MNKLSKLVDLNGFSQGMDGVYQAGSAERDFDYSDGEQSEAQLYRILSTAKDLSSDSEELQRQINDWPSEYHLSSTRANLLRPFNLDGVTRVLELGCGCGSITRYLGEQPGVQVDAVEGSPTRAGLAALRCRDLPNVTISSANFNDLALPENYYDLVLFVGVTEYAGRFSDKATDQEALLDLLNIGKSASKPDGATLIAIENRLGLKYLMGANEDHYAQPFVGLDNYPNSTGIRTYSRDEWLNNTKGFAAQQFVYPFPDYKVPTVLIKHNAISELGDALNSVKSRDYTAPFDLGEMEYQAWRGLAQAGTLDQHANSFLIVLSDEQATIDRLCDFDVRAYSVKQLSYCQPVELEKPVSAEAVQKIQEHLNAEITQLQSHSSNLQAKVDIMSGSIGWRFLNGIRRLFRKTTI